MSPVARLLAAALLGVTVLTVLAGSLALTAGPAAACTCMEVGDRVLVFGQVEQPGYAKSDPAGLTRDQWRTGRLVLGVIGLAFMAFFAFRAVRGWWARRRTSDGE